jgi:hypothetical protein
MRTFKKIFISMLVGAFCLPATVSATEVFFSAERDILPVRDNFLVEVFIDTETAQINAVEGTVMFPDELLALKEIREGNSALNFWLDRPELEGTGKIYFSGMTPGGFSGSDRFLFGIVFETKELGAGSLEFSDAVALINDGLGTQTEVGKKNFDFEVSATAASSEDRVLPFDTEPPESFTPFVGRDPDLFLGRYFAVFSTVDKGAGLDHYEVREGFWGEFKKSESPYVLADQSLRKNIYVKAVDKFGNERLAKIKAPNGVLGLALWAVLVIIIVAVAFVLRKKIWTKRAE